MSAKLIDGKVIAQQVIERVAHQVQQRTEQGHRRPGLAVVLVGADPASEVYVRRKQSACERAGLLSFSHDLPQSTQQEELLALIEQLNRDEAVDGILVQLPLPAHIDESVITQAISPHKDCDGFHPCNVGRLALRQPQLRPCTPKGIMVLLDSTGETYKGRNAVVVGASNIVGRPMMLELALAGATVTLCHRFTEDLAEHVGRADILVIATGRTDVVQAEWIRPGATVIDVGIHRREDGSIHGDLLDVETAMARAGHLTPVPGGVGPMTVAMLMENTLEAADGRHHIHGVSQ
jgi:methylenetetrahydrofolate dehydrogenase (NADP+)/methenyltetrahydrofolate cyclohydrolase